MIIECYVDLQSCLLGVNYWKDMTDDGEKRHLFFHFLCLVIGFYDE